MPEFSISVWDIIVVVVYVAGTRIFFGWLSAKRGGGAIRKAIFWLGGACDGRSSGSPSTWQI